MNLPFLKKKSPSNTPIKRDYFLAIEVADTVVTCACWTLVNNQPQVLTIGKTTSWNIQKDDSLITACDTSISDAVAQLDPTGQIEPQKTVLGIPPHWIENDKLSPEKGRLLKAMTQKLSLEALGFVVTPEAVARYLQVSESVAPTAIILGFSSTDVSVALARLGKLEGLQTVVRSDSASADVAEGLSRFEQKDVLPSRMVVYGSVPNIEDIKQQLLAHPWQTPHAVLKFLHFPKIEVLPANFSLHALAIASGSEMTSHLGSDVQTKDVQPEQYPVISENELDDDYEPDTQPEPVTPQPVPVILPQALGFVLQDRVEEAEPVKKSFSRPSLPKIKIPAGGAIAITAIVVLVGAAALTAAYWYLPKATVTIRVSPKTVDQAFDVTTNTEISSIDQDNKKIPATKIEATVSEEKTAPATGTKLIGDKATGKVKLISGLDQAKTIPAGTVIVASNGLKFTLDSDVKVASASGSPLDKNEFKPGEATASVTAGQIGIESNLTAGNQFKVGNFGTAMVIAKNEEAFSGGNSRQAKVVSKDDIAKLRADLLSSLKDQSKTQLNQKVSSDQVLLPETMETKTVSEDINHKADEIAESVTVKLSVRSSALSYNQTDISSLASTEVLKQLPEKYTPSTTLSPQIALKSQDKSGSVLGIHIEATAVPTLDQDAIKADITGKSVSDATTYITSLPGVSSADITFSPPLPKLLRLLPHSSKNITVSINSEQ